MVSERNEAPKAPMGWVRGGGVSLPTRGGVCKVTMPLTYFLFLSSKWDVLVHSGG